MQKENNSYSDTNATSNLPEGKTGTFSSLLIPNFRILFIGSMLACSTQWIQSVIVNWLVYDITGSGTVLGIVNLVWSLASLLMLLAAGMLVDYYNRRNLILLVIAILFVVNLALGLILVYSHANIAYLFIFVLLVGSAQTLDSTTRQVMVFDVVPRNQTPGALALTQTGWSVTRVICPSLGGFLIIWFSAGGTFLVQAATYFLILVIIFQLKLQPRPRDTVRSSPIQNLKDGAGYIIKEPVARVFIVFSIIMAFLLIPIFFTLPAIYAARVFGDDSGRTLGYLMSAVGVGGIIGGFMVTFLKRWDRWGIIVMGSFLMLALTLLAFALTSSLPLALVILGLSGFFEIIFLTASQTLIQLSIPDQLRGRVTAVVNLNWIVTSLGSLVIGVGSDLIGPQMITIIVTLAGAALGILVFGISPVARNYRLSHSIESRQA